MSRYSKDDFLAPSARAAFIAREADLRGRRDWPSAHWYTDEDFCELYRVALDLANENARLSLSERITEAAIRSVSGVIVTGAHHAACLRRMASIGLPNKGRTDGFMTDRMRFVDRYEGLSIAKVRGQIVHKHAPFDRLMSEDLKPLRKAGE